MQNYSKYSLEKLQEWLFDALHSGASVSEICQSIYDVLDEEEQDCKLKLDTVQSLRKMLQSQTNQSKTCDVNDTSEYCKDSWNSFWENNDDDNDSIKKWILPVEVDGLTGECYIHLPDDLLQVANLKEGDQVEWINNNNGSFTMRKV